MGKHRTTGSFSGPLDPFAALLCNTADRADDSLVQSWLRRLAEGDGPDSDGLPTPLSDLNDEAASLARKGGHVRRGADGNEFVTPDALEMIEADLLTQGPLPEEAGQ